MALSEKSGPAWVRTIVPPFGSASKYTTLLEPSTVEPMIVEKLPWVMLTFCQLEGTMLLMVRGTLLGSPLTVFVRLN